MKIIIVFLLVLAAFGADGINKVEIKSIENRVLKADVFGKNINSLLVIYNNNNITNSCKLKASGATFDSIIRKWELTCNLPNISSRLEIRYLDSLNKPNQLTKFIE
ncbi:hypothetical protein [Campylobacter fetus]|uniref:hypothetical protein n=1 Tax=Campylobacter fetus TaxID=196 RepID=UPI000FC9E385|nr:hypothetical protein [Campylobacter fetus]QQF52736.1 hypothetical protein HHI31_07850 [Campylobacter fetus subsp. venerealis]RUT49799.1 hypothetical protein BWK67_05515 [Campylobacter fetus]RUT50295.1 hypothetical protein BWK51_05495 [Campylobacter fetus]